jgi:diadenosine tetraphosphate (Ap4A) HIT family hydrolase
MAEIDSFGRDPNYFEMLQKANASNRCLLCPEEIEKNNPRESILRELGGWVLMRSLFPYKFTESNPEIAEGHILVFTIRHVISPTELNADERNGFWNICETAQNEFGAKTSAIVMRYSTEEDHHSIGASIQHLHAHIITPRFDPVTKRVPGANSPSAEQVKFYFG